jgi:hypothetical protein
MYRNDVIDTDTLPYILCKLVKLRSVVKIYIYYYVFAENTYRRLYCMLDSLKKVTTVISTLETL